MTRELICFDKWQYTYLRKEYEEKGYTFFSISFFSDSNSIEEINDDDTIKPIIDLSSVSINLLDKGLLYNLEQLISFFSAQTIFISDINSEDYKYNLRYCFDVFTEYKGKTEKSLQSQKEKSEHKVKKITDLGSTELESFFNKFNKSLYGHTEFKKDFKNLIDTFKVFNTIGEHKILSLFLMGESGVGKTEVAQSVFKNLNGSKSLSKINFGNYSSQDALNSLIGSPRGYVGSEGGELFDKVSQTDVGLILIDEFEKATTPVYNYFLDVLETGKAVNSLGEEMHLDGFIIIFTSNIESDKFSEHFSPELRSRFDYKGYFGYLNTYVKEKFVTDRLDSIIYKYNSHFGTRFNSTTKHDLFQEINVRKYNNMRDLNRKIKEVFVNHLKISEKM